jgi:hypothetical protein
MSIAQQHLARGFVASIDETHAKLAEQETHADLEIAERIGDPYSIEVFRTRAAYFEPRHTSYRTSLPVLEALEAESVATEEELGRSRALEAEGTRDAVAAVENSMAPIVLLAKLRAIAAELPYARRACAEPIRALASMRSRGGLPALADAIKSTRILSSLLFDRYKSGSAHYVAAQHGGAPENGGDGIVRGSQGQRLQEAAACEPWWPFAVEVCRADFDRWVKEPKTGEKRVLKDYEMPTRKDYDDVMVARARALTQARAAAASLVRTIAPPSAA